MPKKLPPDERRTDTPPLRIRVNAAERAELDRAAAPEPTSTWARDVLLGEARKHNKALKPTGRKRPSA
jgi:hypothetical protein